MTMSDSVAPPIRHALVLDDDYLSRRLISDALRSRGFSVVESGDAECALRAIASSPRTELVVTDLRMPEVDGDLFVRAVRGMKLEPPGPAVVVVTGDVTSQLELDLQDAGADIVLSKRLGPVLIAAAAEMLVTAASSTEVLAPAPPRKGQQGAVR